MRIKKRILCYILSSIVLLLSFSCKKQDNKNDTYHLQKYVEAREAGLASAHPLASQIGIDILKRGGNAIDAAIAVQFALAVVYPVAGNIGGGGFMIYRTNDGQVYALDFREKAPLRATEKMYQDDVGEIVKDLSTLGDLAAGVPGTVDGMWEAYTRFSVLKDWESLLQPAIELAENGFRLTENQAKNLNSSKDKFIQVNGLNTNVFSSSIEYQENDLFVQKELAKTLRFIQKDGREGFYEGETAQKIEEHMKKRNGIISLEDLSKYQSRWRDVLAFEYDNYSVFSMPPPSSGGILLAQLLQAASLYPIKEWGFHSVQTMHLMIEAEKRAFADRAKHIGDSDFYPVPVEELISLSYVQNRMSTVDLDTATTNELVMAGAFNESEETTHYSIVDPYGNAVSITTTLNGAYGSKSVVEGAGFLLNNEMDDFSAKVGVPNMYGLIGAEANKIEPEKRMLSSMTPTIVEKDNELFLVTGTPGGSTIITSVFQVILNATAFEMNAMDATQAPRFHHQWKPAAVYYEENGFDDALIDSLQQMGHSMKSRSSIGRVETIIKREGVLEIAADKRGDDHAEGY